MERNRFYILLTILTIVFLFSFAALCNQRAAAAEEEKTDVEEGEAAAEEKTEEEEEEEIYSYSEQEQEYFFEVALGSEYGSSQPVIHKWTDDVRIKINGEPTSEDLDSLDKVIADLNSLINDISLETVTFNQNIDIYFTSVNQFESILPSYVPGNMGFFSVWWDSNGVIYVGKILIATDRINQQERSHLIREELTQSLGIMKDSYRYEDSIFYQGWTDTSSYLPIDRAVIRLLYDSRLVPGMTQEQVISALE